MALGLEQLGNKALDVDTRVAAADAVGDLLRTERPLAAAWNALNTVLVDEQEPEALRVAAVAALGNAPAAAVNQLVRTFGNDPRRAIRKAALDTLRRLGVAPVAEPRLQQQLGLLGGPQRVMVLANLASSFGHDARVLAALRTACGDTDAQVRMMGLGGLAMLGELQPVQAAVADADAAVRSHAVSLLGAYSTLESAEVMALGKGLNDADPSVAKAAKTALKRLGIVPMAAPPARRKASAAAPRDAWDWRALLDRCSQRNLADRAYAAGLEDAVVASGWLGFPGADPAELHALEARLGLRLPPSYRALLSLTNGFRRVSSNVGALLPAHQVNPFHSQHAAWIRTWTDAVAPHVPQPSHPRVYGPSQDPTAFDHRLLQEAIQVSTVEDASVVLLVPSVTDEHGEWEAWLWAAWLPGARRHPSLVDLIRAEALTPSR